VPKLSHLGVGFTGRAHLAVLAEAEPRSDFSLTAGEFRSGIPPYIRHKKQKLALRPEGLRARYSLYPTSLIVVPARQLRGDVYGAFRRSHAPRRVALESPSGVTRKARRDVVPSTSGCVASAFFHSCCSAHLPLPV